MINLSKNHTLVENIGNYYKVCTYSASYFICQAGRLIKTPVIWHLIGESWVFS